MKFYSMSGFGRSEEINDKYKLVVEIKSVNNKYFDFNLKIPRYFSALEQEIKKEVNKKITRGKIECYIYYENYSARDFKIVYNADIAKSYYDKIKQIAKDFNLEENFSAFALSNKQEVLTIADNDYNLEELKNIIFPVLIEALDKFNASREIEGENLYTDLKNKILDIKNVVLQIENNSEEIIENYKNNISKKINDFLAKQNLQIDEARVLTEVAIYADKVCIDEELVRIKSHLKRFINVCENEEQSIGKELDYIVQEMNREANTMLSKTQDLNTSNNALTIKTNIEKIREQVQNIE